MDSVQEDYLSEGEKRSLLSRPSETVSSLSESKGMILENPDGTYYHGVLAGKLRKADDGDTGQFANYPRNRILYIVDDDEIALYAGFYDLPTNVDDFLALYLRHQKYFVIFLLCFMFYELFLVWVAYQDQAVAVSEHTQLMTTYRSPAREALTQIYLSAIIGQLVYMVMFYPLGFYAAYKRSVKYYTWFATMALVGLIFQMILAYANRY